MSQIPLNISHKLNQLAAVPAYEHKLCKVGPGVVAIALMSVGGEQKMPAAGGKILDLKVLQ